MFLNLVLEESDAEYKREYPRAVTALLAEELGRNVKFIHFPIKDFRVTAPGMMLELARELSCLVRFVSMCVCVLVCVLPRESLRRRRPGGLTSSAFHACGSASPFRARCCHSSQNK